jgi:hypothetical protein
MAILKFPLHAQYQQTFLIRIRHSTYFGRNMITSSPERHLRFAPRITLEANKPNAKDKLVT